MTIMDGFQQTVKNEPTNQRLNERETTLDQNTLHMYVHTGKGGTLYSEQAIQGFCSHGILGHHISNPQTLTFYVLIGTHKLSSIHSANNTCSFKILTQALGMYCWGVSEGGQEGLGGNCSPPTLFGRKEDTASHFRLFRPRHCNLMKSQNRNVSGNREFWFYPRNTDT